MKWLRFLLNCCPFIFSVLMIAGCSTPIVKMPEHLPDSIKKYKHVSVNAGFPGMKNTGVYLNKGDTYSILATGSIDYCPGGNCNYHDVRPEYGWPLLAKIGEYTYFNPLDGGYNADTISDTLYSGYLYLGYRSGRVDGYGDPLNPEKYNDDSGAFKVDIIVWKNDDWIQIADFFKKMKEKDPNNQAIMDAFSLANERKEIVLAEAVASKEIEETKKEIQELKEKPEKGAELALKPTTEDNPLYRIKPSAIESVKQEKVAQLETKLTKLMETLAQLEEIKNELELGKKKISQLTEELEEKAVREKDLLIRLEDSSTSPPVIVVANPKDKAEVEAGTITLSGVAEDDKGIDRLELFVNNQPLQKDNRGIRIAEKESPKRLEFYERISLQEGENKLKIQVINSDGLTAMETLTVIYLGVQRNVWAAVIGIDNYRNVRHLKYAVKDARAFYDHLVKNTRIPRENITLLINQEATLMRLRSILGTHLKRKAGKEDMVIIYFAGHGATEKDAMSPDEDGLEKYLLPYDANPNDLYASALPMNEISRVFNRIRSERIIFLSDACYSGASGGRTINLAGVRSNISDAFLDRIAGGKGRIILTASGPNEVSIEDDRLKHGVFTYFLLEGLKGKADTDKDRVITVDEIYGFLSKEVPQATGQEQHPVKKGTVEGQLIMEVLD